MKNLKLTLALAIVTLVAFSCGLKKNEQKIVEGSRLCCQRFRQP